MHRCSGTGNDDFLKGILIFTVIVHAAILLLGTVVPWAWGMVAGPDVTELKEEERLELAVKEARATLSDIAKEYGLKSPDELSRRLAGGARPAPKPDPADPEGGQPEAGGTPEDPAEEPSEIEKEINKVAPGPETPPIPEDDDEDLFK